MQHSAQTDYTLLRVALQMYDKPLSELEEGERTSVMQQANREMAIARRLLDSEEAGSVVIPASAVEQSVAELRARFDSPQQFDNALQQNSLDGERLRDALAEELRVEAVLEQLLSDEACVSEQELEIYYYQHLEKFELPETRTARHILITVNEAFAENSAVEARRRLQELASLLARGEGSFGELAAQHSECPTAMHEGHLGRLRPGQLYPELDRELFAMGEGEISPIVSSPVGLHLLYCEQIHPPTRRTFSEVRDKLHAHLESKKRTRLLRQWLKQSA